MRIVIETMPHSTQRYPTVGDWWTDPDGTWNIRVSEMNHWVPEFLVALHELVEMAGCKQHGVDEDAVTRFDMQWQAFGNIDEPGDDATSPYYNQHQFASGLERIMAAQLGVSWPWYEAAIDSL
jgi:hypothetical protein